MVQTTLHVCSTCLCFFCITRVLWFSNFHNLVQAGYFNNNNCPLTAVLSVSMAVIPNFPCFYRGVLRVWCHLWPNQGRSTCAKLPGFWLVSLYLLCGSHDHCLFWMTLIDQFWSYDQNNVPWQFSTELSSSGGIFCKKTWLFSMKIV